MRKDYPLSVVYLFAVVAMFFWSLAFIWVPQAYDLGFRPFTVLFFRLIVASVVLTIASVLLDSNEKITKKDKKLFFLLAFAEPFCYFMGESFGMLYVTPTMAATIVATIPLVTPFFAWFFMREGVNIYEIIGLIVSFAGVLVLVMQDLNLGGEPLGVILMFVAVLSGCFYCIILKKLTSNYNPITITRYQTYIGMLMFMPFFFIFDTVPFLKADFSLIDFRYILYLGVLPSSVSFTLMAVTVHRIGIVRTNVFSNIIPVLTAILAFFILKESFTAVKIVAMFVVIFGLVISQINKLKVFK